MADLFVSLVGFLYGQLVRMSYFTPIATSKPACVVSKLFVATPALFTVAIVSHLTAHRELGGDTKDIQPFFRMHERLCRLDHTFEIHQV
jgi:hypothetical protein